MRGRSLPASKHHCPWLTWKLSWTASEKEAAQLGSAAFDFLQMPALEPSLFTRKARLTGPQESHRCLGPSRSARLNRTSARKERFSALPATCRACGDGSTPPCTVRVCLSFLRLKTPEESHASNKAKCFRHFQGALFARSLRFCADSFPTIMFHHICKQHTFRGVLAKQDPQTANHQMAHRQPRSQFAQPGRSLASKTCPARKSRCAGRYVDCKRSRCRTCRTVFDMDMP